MVLTNIKLDIEKAPEVACGSWLTLLYSLSIKNSISNIIGFKMTVFKN